MKNDFVDIVERVEKLEKSVFGQNKLKIKISNVEKNFTGPSGGSLVLIKDGFLKQRKTTNDVLAELEKRGFIYKRQVVQTALNRLSNKNGPLVKIEEKDGIVYVERK